MPIRSVQGFLFTVLATCAAAWHGLTVVGLRDPFLGADALHGMALAVAVAGLGVLLWAVLATAEAVGGRGLAVIVLGLGLLAAPRLAQRADAAFWERRTDGVGWVGSAIAWPTSAVGDVRGSLGYVCGGAYAVRLRLDAHGRGVGRAEWVEHVLLYTLRFALSPLDGPESFAVRGELVGDRLEVTALERWPGDTWSVPLVTP